MKVPNESIETTIVISPHSMTLLASWIVTCPQATIKANGNRVQIDIAINNRDNQNLIISLTFG